MSLTHTAYVSRKIIKYGGVGIAIFTGLYMLIGMGIAAYVRAHPPYTPPDVKFGLLPKTVFPEKKFEKKNFTTELASDKFPVYKDQARVFVITRPDNTFLALDQDTITARDLGFVGKPSEVKYGVYEFKNDSLNLTLTMNVLDGSFSLKYPYESDQLLLNPEKMPTKEEAVNIAKGYLSGGSKFPTDLVEGDAKVSFWKIGFEGLKSVSSLSEANIVKVDFFRKVIADNMKIMSTDINGASVSVLVTGSQTEGRKVVEVNYKYANIDREIYSTYPIKTAEEAFNDLKSGNYWPASDVVANNVAIRNIYLAYFEPISLTNYLQPIYVFEGDGKFAAYVTAVKDSYIK
ncbi:MAG: hypothetical protein WAV41_05410 [Microgenomates group bacterium]